MSKRSLIEINHDFWPEANSAGLLDALTCYLRNATSENAADLERFGLRVIGMRHHSEKFIIDGRADGFPPRYLTPSRQSGGEG